MTCPAICPGSVVGPMACGLCERALDGRTEGEVSINRYAAKVDSNQADIVEALKACGCDVEVIRRPVDLAVGRAGKTYLLEVKRPKGGKKTPAQEEFFEKWRGHAAIVTTPEEALMAVGLRGGAE